MYASQDKITHLRKGDGNPGIIGCFRVAIPSFLRACNPRPGFAKGISVRKSPPAGRGWKPWDYWLFQGCQPFVPQGLQPTHGFCQRHLCEKIPARRNGMETLGLSVFVLTLPGLRRWKVRLRLKPDNVRQRSTELTPKSGGLSAFQTFRGAAAGAGVLKVSPFQKVKPFLVTGVFPPRFDQNQESYFEP